MYKWLMFFLIVIALSAEAFGDTLNPGGTIMPGGRMLSANGQYSLDMQGDGNLVLYRRQPTVSVVWSSGTQGHPGTYAVMQTDGNFVLYNPSGKAVWTSWTQGHPNAYLALQDDGNAVVYQLSGAWSSNTAIAEFPSSKTGSAFLPAGSVLRPGQSAISGNGFFELAMQGDGNLVLYSPGRTARWHSKTAGTPGAWMQVQYDGNVLVYAPGARGIWNANTQGPGTFLAVQDDGNLVIYTPKPLWAVNWAIAGYTPPDQKPRASCTAASRGAPLVPQSMGSCSYTSGGDFRCF
jgi:pseudomonalisin